MMMRRVLIANRGEIAVRIIKTLNRLRIESVLIYHNDEQAVAEQSGATFISCFERNALGETFLNMDEIIRLALKWNVDAIHPGYGFLSENASFAKRCIDNGLIFIGPQPDVIAQMGDKQISKQIAQSAGVPVLKSYHEDALTPDTIPFPLLVKAVAGGGGKGMRIVYSEADLENSLQAVKREAQSYFGDNRVIIEPFLENARHIEVQLLGDNFGNVMHLFTRECSIQRNKQKVIEEAPAVSLSKELETKILDAAVQLAKSIRYTNAGTIEFLVSGDLFYFLEMNTRLQVEHPVTEAITGMDLVEQQVRLAEGKPISESLKNLSIKGHAIEARICAEKPFQRFIPSVGKIKELHFPENARVDTFLSTYSETSSNFDSLVAKLIVHAPNRKESVLQLQTALHNTFIAGIETNLSLLEIISRDKNYTANTIDTNYLENKLSAFTTQYEPTTEEERIALTAFLVNNLCQNDTENWKTKGFYLKNRKLPVQLNNVEKNVKILDVNATKLEFEFESEIVQAEMISKQSCQLIFLLNNSNVAAFYTENDGYDSYQVNSKSIKIASTLHLRMAHAFMRSSVSDKNTAKGKIKSPLFGKVLQIPVEKGAIIKKGEVLLTLECMKTENRLIAEHDGEIEAVHVTVGQQIKEKTDLISINYL